MTRVDPTPAAAPPPADPVEPTGRRVGPGVLLAVLLSAGIAFAVSQTLVLPAIPALAERYGASTTATSWVLTGFLLSASVTTPVVGSLGDRYGKARVLTVVLLMFAAGGVVAALAPTLGVLVAARVFQGVAAGVFPLSFGIIRDAFPRDRIPGAISTVSAVFGIGGGIGLPLSGVIVDNADVAWLFWLSLVAVLPAVALRWVPPSPPAPAEPIDWTGAAVLGGALTALLLGVTQAPGRGWTSPLTLALLVAGVAGLLGWVLLESRLAHPLIRLDVLAQRSVAATNATSFLVGTALFAGFLLIPQLAQAPAASGYGLGATATVAGLLLVPSAAAQVVVGAVAGRLGVRIGFRATLVAGAVLVCASFAVLAAFHTTAWNLVLGGVGLGAGVALAFASMANLVVSAVRQGEVGVATGINTVLRTLGGSFGAAIATTVVALGAGEGGQATDGGYTAALVVAAVLALASAVTALLVPRTSAPSRT